MQSNGTPHWNIPGELKRFCSMSGRVNRSFYLSWTLFAFVVAVGTAIVPPTLKLSAGWGRVSGFVCAALLWPALAIHTKRLHDLNLSGWWTLAGLVPYVGIPGLFAACSLLPGSRESNRYGAPSSSGTPLIPVFAASACATLVLAAIAIKRMPLINDIPKTQVNLPSLRDQPPSQPDAGSTNPLSTTTPHDAPKITAQAPLNSPSKLSTQVAQGAATTSPTTVAGERSNVLLDDKELYAAAREINAHLPTMVNRDVRLDGVTPAHGTLQYNYTLIHRTATHLPEDDRLDAQPLIDYYCHDQSYLVEGGITVSWAYRTKDGVTIKVISASPARCK